MNVVTCPGCGLSHERRGLAREAGLAASGECRAESGLVLSAFYEPDLVDLRQHVVDAYACTHPDISTRRGRMTTGLCLMTLDLYLECGQPVSDGSRMHQEMMRAGAGDFPALDPPPPGTAPTHRLLTEAPRATYAELSRIWGAAVWAAWEQHHTQVREWNLRWCPHRVR